MRSVFYYKLCEYTHIPQEVQVLLTHSILLVWGQLMMNFIHTKLVVFRLTEGRLELQIISVYLFWVCTVSYTPSCTTAAWLEVH